MSLFEGIRKPWAAWEMTMEAHDPANNRTLDLSGNGRHLTFGDGATAATFPRKMVTKRGYQNSSTTYLNRAVTAWTSNHLTIEAFILPYLRDNSGYFIDFRDAASTQCNLAYVTSSYRFYSGALVAANAASKFYLSGPQRGIVHLVGRYDGTNTSLFMDGSLVASAATPLAPQAGAPTVFRVFQSYAGATQYIGCISFLIRLWDLALTATEIQELYRKAKEELHRI